MKLVRCSKMVELTEEKAWDKLTMTEEDFRFKYGRLESNLTESQMFETVRKMEGVSWLSKTLREGL